MGLCWFGFARHFTYKLSWTSVDPEKKLGEPSLWVTGFSAETAGLPVIKLQRVGPRKTSCPDSVAIGSIFFQFSVLLWYWIEPILDLFRDVYFLDTSNSLFALYSTTVNTRAAHTVIAMICTSTVTLMSIIRNYFNHCTIEVLFYDFCEYISAFFWGGLSSHTDINFVDVATKYACRFSKSWSRPFSSYSIISRNLAVLTLEVWVFCTFIYFLFILFYCSPETRMSNVKKLHPSVLELFHD